MLTKENLNIFKSALNFIREFLLKKNGGWILFILSLVFGFWYTGEEREKGKEEGKKDSLDQVKSLQTTLKNNSNEIYTLNGRVAFYKNKLDTCENTRYTDKRQRYEELSDEIDKAREIAQRNNKRLKDELNKK